MSKELKKCGRAQEELFPNLSLGNCPVPGLHWRSEGDSEEHKIQAAHLSPLLNIQAKPSGEGCSVFKNKEVPVFFSQPELSVFPKQACENTQLAALLCFIHQREGFCQALTKLSENL